MHGIVGRFTVGSKLVIDGKNSDGKDQHDQQCSDNGRVNSILEFRIPGVEVSKHFTTEVAKSRNREVELKCRNTSPQKWRNAKWRNDPSHWIKV
jgi:hypothetical protein